MKKILSLLAIGVLFACTSCGDNKTEKTAGETMTDKKDNSMAEKNLAASHAVSKAFETGDVSGLDNVIAANYVDHTEMGDKMGVDSLKAAVKLVHGTMKDMKMETLSETADNEYVYSRMRFTGTSDGSMGMAKGPYDMHVIEFAKFKDGKAVEHWEFMDMQNVMKMMSSMMPPKMDDKMKAK
jgi:ketosteroid isomerase-like protein